MAMWSRLSILWVCLVATMTRFVYISKRSSLIAPVIIHEYYLKICVRSVIGLDWMWANQWYAWSWKTDYGVENVGYLSGNLSGDCTEYTFNVGRSKMQTHIRMIVSIFSLFLIRLVQIVFYLPDSMAIFSDYRAGSSRIESKKMLKSFSRFHLSRGSHKRLRK